MKSRTRQLIKKLERNKDIIGWNEQRQMEQFSRNQHCRFSQRSTAPKEELNFNPKGWEVFSKALGHLNAPEGIVRNENCLELVQEYKTKRIPEGVPKPTTLLTRVQAAKKKKRRDVMSSQYAWLK